MRPRRSSSSRSYVSTRLPCLANLWDLAQSSARPYLAPPALLEDGLAAALKRARGSAEIVNFVNDLVYQFRSVVRFGRSMEPSQSPSSGFSYPKKEILFLLKRKAELSLREIAAELGISKVGALKHLAHLEAQGLLAREFRASGIGRPQVFFRLTPESSGLFPAAYAQMSLYALEYIEQKLGRPAVMELLRQRTREVFLASRNRMQGKLLRERVAELARIREEGGYMAEVGPRRGATSELLEHNCPILAIAGRFGEACEVERQLFQSLLRADVDVAHRVVAGDAVCRFLVRPSAERTT